MGLRRRNRSESLGPLLPIVLPLLEKGKRATEGPVEEEGQ